MADGERAEERAEEELELKRQTLQLERQKFKYTQSRDQLNTSTAAWIKGINGILVADSAIVFACVVYYKQISEIVGKGVVNGSIVAATISFLMAVLAFIFALDNSTLHPEMLAEKKRSYIWRNFLLTLTSTISLLAFLLSIFGPIFTVAKLRDPISSTSPTPTPSGPKP